VEGELELDGMSIGSVIRNSWKESSTDSHLARHS
jgi:hypothetical protein